MKSDRSKRRHREKIYELLLGLCVVVLVSFAFPRLSWIGPLGYGLIALLLTQLVMIRKTVLTVEDRLYQLLGLAALVALLLWQITPVRWVVSGVPLVLTWSSRRANRGWRGARQRADQSGWNGRRRALLRPPAWPGS